MVLGVGFTYLALVGVELVVRAVALDLAGKVTEAEVTLTERVARGRRSVNSSYVLRYRFRVDDKPHWYTCGILLWPTSTSIGVSSPVWEAARESGHIEITYLPWFPTINRPRDHTPLEGWLCSGVALIPPGGLAIFLWTVFFGGLKGWRKEAQPGGAPEDGPVP